MVGVGVLVAIISIGVFVSSGVLVTMTIGVGLESVEFDVVNGCIHRSH